MSHDLATLHTRLTCLQAECAIWQIRQKAQALLDRTTDPERRVRLSEVVRIGRCPPDRVIRGAHGYFAGCMDGNGAFHTTDVTKKFGGLKHEAEARFQRTKGNEDKAKAAEDKATKAAAQLTPKQRDDLTTLQGKLEDETQRLAGRLATMDAKSKGYQALFKEATTRQAELSMVKAHLARADAAAKSAPAKAGGGKRAAGKVIELSATPLYHSPENQHLDPYGPMSILFMHRMFGSDQLAAALGDHTTERLKDAASLWVRDHPEDGRPASLTKAGLVKYLTDVAIKHDGRIASQADATKAYARDPLRPTAPLKASDLLAAKGGSKKESESTASRPRQKEVLAAKALYNIRGAYVDPYGPINFLYMHRIYGSAQLATALGDKLTERLRIAADLWAKDHPEDGKPSNRTRKDALIAYLTKVAVAHDGRIASQEDAEKAQKKDPDFKG